MLKDLMLTAVITVTLVDDKDRVVKTMNTALRVQGEAEKGENKKQQKASVLDELSDCYDAAVYAFMYNTDMPVWDPSGKFS